MAGPQLPTGTASRAFQRHSRAPPPLEMGPPVQRPGRSSASSGSSGTAGTCHGTSKTTQHPLLHGVGGPEQGPGPSVSSVVVASGTSGGYRDPSVAHHPDVLQIIGEVARVTKG